MKRWMILNSGRLSVGKIRALKKSEFSSPNVHPPEVDDGFAYIDGHKFECLHAVDSGKFHSVFVLKDEGDNDLASFVTFDNAGRIHCEVEPLKEIVGVKIPYSGGGTCFGEGLRVANEVLSRNNFEQF
ncbi:hypothetical protein F441_21773 [Phytophthora nicotianae CJ01A1]|uniref:Uncharacterized protein n=1 Tax=Phytophthora nicotianae CJ01A1 TaxID=1317063 RepID=W2VR75_PHYNI|nr:hypothetical protein F441_21773 [Phytophthora nicotianae CJ01A1]